MGNVMGSKVRAVLGAVLVVMVIGAGCSDGDGDERDTASDDTQAEASDSTDQQDADAADTTDTTDDAAAADDTAGDLVDPGDIDAPEGSDPELRQEYIDAIVSTTETDESDVFNSTAVECLAVAFVDAAGTDALSAAITPEELAASDEQTAAELGVEFPEGAGDVFYDEASSCMDLRSLILANLTGGDPATTECVADALDDDMVKDYLVAVLIDGLDESDPELAPIQQRLDDAIEPCIPPG